MGYIAENLMKDERIIYEGRLSAWALTKWLIPGGIMISFIFLNTTWSTTVFALGVGMMAAALIEFATTEMAVTTERVIEKKGWIARRTTEISLSKVEGVEVNQTIVQRLLNYGNILVSGVGSHKARISSVASPLDFRKAFLSVLEAHERVSRQRKDEPGPMRAPSGAVAQNFDEELASLVVEINGRLTVLDKEALLSFVQRWKTRDERALSLIEFNERADGIQWLKS